MVRRAQANDAAAFEELVREFGPRAYRFLVVRIGDEGEARDALQEMLVAAWQGLPTLKDPEKFWVWLAGIAVHKSSDAKRRATPLPTVDRPERETIDHTLEVELRIAVASLPAHLQEVLILRHVLGFSEKDTARALSIGIGTVKSRAWRARRSLAGFIQQGQDDG